MTGGGAALAAAAERLIGVPFRLRGRDPARGLDCLGLVATALAASGTEVEVPAGYSLRRLDIGRWLALAERLGLSEAGDGPSAGDILLLHPGPGQWHLGIAAADGALIHAHAVLGRVVRTPAPVPWPIQRRWRFLSR